MTSTIDPFELSGSTQWLKTVFTTAVDAIIAIDKHGTIVVVNPATERLFGHSVDALNGQNLALLIPPNEFYQSMSVADYMDAYAGVGHSAEGLHQDGSCIPVHLAVSRFEAGGEQYFLGVIRDMTAEMEYQRSLEEQARTDSLTGLMNREAVEETLQRKIREVGELGAQYWLAYLDLDGFKAINDSHGHHAGDIVLRCVAHAILSSFDRETVIGRMGGDEFAVVLPAQSEAEALEKVEECCRAVRNFRLPWYKRILSVGICAGVVQINDESSLKDLLVAADTCCYEAKRLGRNRVRVADHNDLSMREAVSLANWATMIPSALESNRFDLHLMGIYDADRRCVGCEALIRLPMDGRVVMPGEIIAAAEAYGLMPAIDEWVMEEVLRKVDGMTRLPDSFYVGMNFSTLTLSQPDFLERFQRILSRFNVRPSSLVMEVTETATLADRDNIMRSLAGVQDMGCGVSLDDFGQGTSSLTMMDEMPVDYLKIDGEFVHDASSNALHREIVRAIASVARAADVRTVAEKVEDLDDTRLLRSLGVDTFQGFGFHKPVPWNEFFELNKLGA